MQASGAISCRPLVRKFKLRSRQESSTVVYAEPRHATPAKDQDSAGLGRYLQARFTCGQEFRSQIIRATTGILRKAAVSVQLPDRVPMNTIAALTPAGNAGS
jgi:hypothetical protein